LREIVTWKRQSLSRGVSYKTAWHLRYRIRDALTKADAHLAEDHRTSEWHGQQETRNRGTEGKTGKHRHKGRGTEGKGDTDSADAIRSLSISGTGSSHQVSDEHLNALLNALTFHFDRQENTHTFDGAVQTLGSQPLPLQEIDG
jgi:hypothetical protein